MSVELSLILIVVFALVIFAVCLRFLQEWRWGVGVMNMIVGKNNAAAGIEYAGFFLGVWIITSSVLDGVSLHPGRVQEMIESGTLSLMSYAVQIICYGIGSILLLGAAGWGVPRLLLQSNLHETVRANNIAAGIVIASGYVSTALVIAGVLSPEGQGGDLTASVVFFGAGMLALILCTYLFRFLTRYDDSREIRDDNGAAALSYGGMMVAIGMIIGHAVEGDFTDYRTSFLLFGKAVLIIVALYPLRQWLVQGILLGDGFRWYGGKLDDEISVGRNIGAGAVEAATYLAFAVLAIHLGY